MGRLFFTAIVAVALFAACGDGDPAADAGIDPGPAPVEDLLPTDAEDPDAGDPGPRDPGPTDPGQPDLGPADPGPQDLGPQDLGPSDPGPSDPGQPDLGPLPDPGPSFDITQNLSEVAAACTYVVESICDKVLTKCDVLGLIPENWMDSCTNWLVGYHYTISGACTSLDEMESADPNVQLIKSMGPLALQQCVDNFQCTVENLTKVGTVVMPMITGGAAPSTGDILGVVAGLCFK